MQINNFFKKASFLIIALSIITSSCKKETEGMKTDQTITDPVSEIREIVGNHGRIIQLNKSQVNSYNKSAVTQRDSNLKLLSIQEFRQLYKDLNNIQYVQIGLDSNLNRKKATSEYADDEYEYDDPGKPGLHKVQFYAFPINLFDGTFGINNSPFVYSTLNLWYETDIHGRVIGTPILFYSGLSVLHVWTQMIISNIQFNQNKLISTFSIGGTNLYGINIFGQNMGWTTSSRYIITISMDSNYGEDGKVIIKAEQN
jgi:hypothetical protein